MKKENICHQGTGWCKRRSSFTILHSLLLIFLWSGQALAAQSCKPASIRASTPTSDFVVNSNGTVTHKKTGLMWKRCSEGQAWNGSTCTGSARKSMWQAALQQAQTVNNGVGFAGFNDWRVPNKKELDSIMEEQCFSPSINATIFPATVNGMFWSSSPYAANATDAWIVDFGGGADSHFGKSGFFYVRLVRGGQ